MASISKSPIRENAIMKLAHNRVTIIAVLFAILLCTIAKGWGHRYGDANYHLPFWYLTYEYGFLRRAFMGTVAAILTGPPAYRSFMNQIYWWHVTAVFLLNTLVLAWAWYAIGPKMNRARVHDVALLLALYFSSQFVSIMVWNEGYFDPYLLLIVMACFASLVFADRASNLWWVWIMATVGVAIHEAFFFLWVPFILCGYLIGRRLPLALAAWPFVCYLGMIIAEGFTPIGKVLGGLPPFSQFVYRRDVYNLDTVGRMEGMLYLIAHEWLHTLLALALYTLPALLIGLGICQLAGFKTTRQKLLCMATIYAPISITIIAWDIARFLNMTAPIAIFTLLCVLTVKRRGGKVPA